MKEYKKTVQVRWSDLDPNFHLRHSVYYDWGAQVRVEFLQEHGLTHQVMDEQQFGPILFREECVFRKEIRPGDPVQIDMQLTRARHDYSRWSIRHTVTKGEQVTSAILTVDGAWLNLAHRKLATPPPVVGQVFGQMPVSEDFQWLD